MILGLTQLAQAIAKRSVRYPGVRNPRLKAQAHCKGTSELPRILNRQHCKNLTGKLSSQLQAPSP